MSEEKPLNSKISFEESFFNHLREAQPIAFMASLSMIIAVFAFSNKEFFLVFEYAAIASSMFLIAFISSMIGKILRDREEIEKSSRTTITDLARSGIYFFFVLGVIHLILILYEFAKSVTSITLFIVSFIYLAAALVMTYRAKVGLKNELKNIKSYRGLSGLLFILLIISILISGISSMYFGITHSPLIPLQYSTYLIFFIPGFAFPSILFSALGNKKESGSFTNPSYKPGISSTIVTILFLLAIFAVFVFVTNDIIKSNEICNDECKIQYEKMGFVCNQSKDSEPFICRFISDKAFTIEIPENASIAPNEKNFDPFNLELTIEVNNVVKWINHDNVLHSIVGENAFYSGILKPGETFTWRFEDPGIYSYYGDFPWLKGQIIVKPLDNSLQSDTPLTQISNIHQNYFKIFREGDHEGIISNITINSDHIIINSIPEIESGTTIYLTDHIVNSCKKLENSKFEIEYLTLQKIIKKEIPYVIFLSELKVEDNLNPKCPLI